MGICDVCGNEYDKTFIITRGTQQHVFDSFECAIHLMAPRCAHCGCAIIGHGLQSKTGQYCCASCARHAGESGLVDRKE